MRPRTRTTEADASLVYEGRGLPRPGEELVDQGLAFDLVTLVSRRQALRVLGVGAGVLGLAACTPSTNTASGSGATSTGSGSAEIPDETAGPYPGDGSNGPNVLERSGIVRSDIRSSLDGGTTAEGVPMTLELTIQDLATGGAPFAGVAVYVWHCDREGRYSMYSEGVTEETYLRGVQVADDDGIVRFTSILPACYTGRWPHIHFEVYPDQPSITDSTAAIATSQVALPKDVCDDAYATTGYESSVRNLAQLSLESDNVFGDDSGASQLATVSGTTGEGYTVALTVGVDTGTTPTGGQTGGGTDGAPPGAPGGAPPSGGPGGTPPSGGPGGTPPSGAPPAPSAQNS
jgi:protocatechuate 3,4-dioxygenase beta subunit